MLEVTFTPIADDLVTFYKFALKRSPALRKRLVVSWVAIPLGLVVIALGLWLAGVYPPVAIGLAGAGVVVALFFPLIRRSWIGQWAHQHARASADGGISPITLTLTADECRMRGKVTDTTARWDKMKGGVVGPDHTFVFFTEQLAVVVPRVALGSDAEYAAVRDFVAARLPELS